MVDKGFEAVEPPRMIEVGEHLLRVQVRGTGPTVVLDCGGSGAGIGSWGGELEAALAERATVVTYDRAGVGGSSGTQASSVTEMADSLHRLVAALDVERPAVFVGWSYGGLVTQMYAMRHPADVAGLVFVDPTATQEPPGSPVFRRVSFALTPHLLRMSALFARRNARSLRELAVTLQGMPGAIQEVAATRKQARFPEVPLRVVTAGKRPRMPAAQLEHLEADHLALAQQSPDGQILVAQHAGHQIPFDQPTAIVEAVDAVLGR
ncbi:alpha/beta hydrolase [Rhodococcus rhodochrous]|uniref:Alpha/beta hydrolase n=1 Tax=Rhodococcus rhodochrous TaxID=1829 RepID=A0AAW4XPD0_RHORH|nr:alpha/beta hydrolase [Rhodococcus rhodochrous]MCD2114937.1 alpha/beta hydrolase [Rhodococcus rhodochrous]